jgi:hypothetical protein
MGNIRHFRELEVYRAAMDAALRIFMISHPDEWTIRTVREGEAEYDV